MLEHTRNSHAGLCRHTGDGIMEIPINSKTYPHDHRRVLPRSSHGDLAAPERPENFERQIVGRSVGASLLLRLFWQHRDWTMVPRPPAKNPCDGR